jgi:hypothetical protein
LGVNFRPDLRVNWRIQKQMPQPCGWGIVM